MFKVFRDMMKHEKATLTPEEIAYVETPATVPTDTQRNDHADALAGSRAACYGLSLEYMTLDREKAYLWATVALLAGHPEANGWMNTLKQGLSRNQTYLLEVLARKWYQIHKADFARTKATRAEAVKEMKAMGIRSGGDPNYW